MNKSIVFFILLFFLSSGFVKHDTPIIGDGGQQRDFLELLSHFEKVSLPFSMDLKNYEQKHFSEASIRKRKAIGKVNSDFTKLTDKFIPSSKHRKFSRMGRSIIEPLARFYPDDLTVGIVYSSKLQFGGEMMADYFIGYYDFKGNLLGRTKKKRIGQNDFRIGFTNMQHVQTFTILPSGKITTIFYDTHWKQKIGAVSSDQNELLGFRKVKNIDYEYSTKKGFQEVAQIAAARP